LIEHTLKIVPIERNHMTEVIEILQAISKFKPKISELDIIWKNFINQQNVFSMVALQNNHVVGYGSIVIENKIRGGKLGHIEDIVTSENYYRKGIGKLILNSLYKISVEHNCYKISLSCKEDNIPFYKKCLYEQNGLSMNRML